jgi:hypothetical protein
VLGQTSARHTTEEFVAFLAQLVALEPKKREIHIIADNLSAHRLDHNVERMRTRNLKHEPAFGCVAARPQ